METLKFKTNIKCSGCEATVTPFLNNLAGEFKWQVNTAVPEKTLTVEAENITAAQILTELMDHVEVP